MWGKNEKTMWGEKQKKKKEKIKKTKINEKTAKNKNQNRKNKYMWGSYSTCPTRFRASVN